MMLRVTIDSLGYIGLVEVTPTTTLKQLRVLLLQTFDVDTLPPYYQFLLPTGVTVGMRKESTTLAVHQASITLLPTAESPLAVPVWVRLWNGSSRFCLWSLSSTTVAALRTEASRFWHLSPSDTVLLDHTDSLWPDSVRVHAALAQARAEGVAGGFGEEEEEEDIMARPPLFKLHLRDRTAERVMAFSFPSSQHFRRLSTVAAAASAAGGGGGALGDRMAAAAAGVVVNPGSGSSGSGSNVKKEEDEEVENELNTAMGWGGGGVLRRQRGGNGNGSSRGTGMGAGAALEEDGMGGGGGEGDTVVVWGGMDSPEQQQQQQEGLGVGEEGGLESHPLKLPPPPPLPPVPYLHPTVLHDENSVSLLGFAPLEPLLWRAFSWYASAGGGVAGSGASSGSSGSSAPGSASASALPYQSHSSSEFDPQTAQQGGSGSNSSSSSSIVLRARQWRCLLDDCGLLGNGPGAVFPDAQSAALLATRLVRGGGGTTALAYHDFLAALVVIAWRQLLLKESRGGGSRRSGSFSSLSSAAPSSSSSSSTPTQPLSLPTLPTAALTGAVVAGSGGMKRDGALPPSFPLPSTPATIVSQMEACAWVSFLVSIPVGGVFQVGGRGVSGSSSAGATRTILPQLSTALLSLVKTTLIPSLHRWDGGQWRREAILMREAGGVLPTLEPFIQPLSDIFSAYTAGGVAGSAASNSSSSSSNSSGGKGERGGSAGAVAGRVARMNMYRAVAMKAGRVGGGGRGSREEEEEEEEEGEGEEKTEEEGGRGLRGDGDDGFGVGSEGNLESAPSSPSHHTRLLVPGAPLTLSPTQKASSSSSSSLGPHHRSMLQSAGVSPNSIAGSIASAMVAAAAAGAAASKSAPVTASGGAGAGAGAGGAAHPVRLGYAHHHSRAVSLGNVGSSSSSVVSGGGGGGGGKPPSSYANLPSMAAAALSAAMVGGVGGRGGSRRGGVKKPSSPPPPPPLTALFSATPHPTQTLTLPAFMAFLADFELGAGGAPSVLLEGQWAGGCVPPPSLASLSYREVVEIFLASASYGGARVGSGGGGASSYSLPPFMSGDGSGGGSGSHPDEVAGPGAHRSRLSFAQFCDALGRLCMRWWAKWVEWQCSVLGMAVPSNPFVTRGGGSVPQTALVGAAAAAAAPTAAAATTTTTFMPLSVMLRALLQSMERAVNRGRGSRIAGIVSGQGRGGGVGYVSGGSGSNLYTSPPYDAPRLLKGCTAFNAVYGSVVGAGGGAGSITPSPKDYVALLSAACTSFCLHAASNTLQEHPFPTTTTAAAAAATNNSNTTTGGSATMQGSPASESGWRAGVEERGEAHRDILVEGGAVADLTKLGLIANLAFASPPHPRMYGRSSGGGGGGAGGGEEAGALFSIPPPLFGAAANNAPSNSSSPSSNGGASNKLLQALQLQAIPHTSHNVLYPYRATSSSSSSAFASAPSSSSSSTSHAHNPASKQHSGKGPYAHRRAPSFAPKVPPTFPTDASQQHQQEAGKEGDDGATLPPPSLTDLNDLWAEQTALRELQSLVLAQRQAEARTVASFLRKGASASAASPSISPPRATMESAANLALLTAEYARRQQVWEQLQQARWKMGEHVAEVVGRQVGRGGERGGSSREDFNRHSGGGSSSSSSGSLPGGDAHAIAQAATEKANIAAAMATAVLAREGLKAEEMMGGGGVGGMGAGGTMLQRFPSFFPPINTSPPLSSNASPTNIPSTPSATTLPKQPSQQQQQQQPSESLSSLLPSTRNRGASVDAPSGKRASSSPKERTPPVTPIISSSLAATTSLPPTSKSRAPSPTPPAPASTLSAPPAKAASSTAAAPPPPPPAPSTAPEPAEVLPPTATLPAIPPIQASLTLPSLRGASLAIPPSTSSSSSTATLATTDGVLLPPPSEATSPSAVVPMPSPSMPSSTSPAPSAPSLAAADPIHESEEPGAAPEHPAKVEVEVEGEESAERDSAQSSLPQQQSVGEPPLKAPTSPTTSSATPVVDPFDLGTATSPGGKSRSSSGGGGSGRDEQPFEPFTPPTSNRDVVEPYTPFDPPPTSPPLETSPPGDDSWISFPITPPGPPPPTPPPSQTSLPLFAGEGKALDGNQGGGAASAAAAAPTSTSTSTGGGGGGRGSGGSVEDHQWDFEEPSNDGTESPTGIVEGGGSEEGVTKSTPLDDSFTAAEVEVAHTLPPPPSTAAAPAPQATATSTMNTLSRRPSGSSSGSLPPKPPATAGGGMLPPSRSTPGRNSMTGAAGGGAMTDPRLQVVLQSRLAYKRVMQEGCVFIKYGRRGWPKKKFVWLTGEVDAIRWRAPGTEAKPLKQSELLAGKGCVRVPQILEVYPDPSTAVMQANKAYLKNPALCFSIVVGDRTLDLEAHSMEVKTQWVQALLALIKYRGGM